MRRCSWAEHNQFAGRKSCDTQRAGGGPDPRRLIHEKCAPPRLSLSKTVQNGRENDAWGVPTAVPLVVLNCIIIFVKVIFG